MSRRQFRFVDELPGRPYEGRGPYTRTRGRNTDLFEHAEALRANPMRWSPHPRRLTAASAARIAQYIRDGCSQAYNPALGFEAVAREGVCYVRHNPDGAVTSRDSFRRGYEKGRREALGEVRAAVRDFRGVLRGLDGWDERPRGEG